MKKLEDKILDKVYRFETKNTLYRLLTVIAAIVFFSTLAVSAGIIVIHQLNEQKTWDLLELFSEDREIIRKYLWETIGEFYNELPKTEMLFLVIMSIVTIVIIFVTVKHSKKIKNKLQALFSYWNIKN